MLNRIIYNTFIFLVSILARIFLFIIGWKSLSDDVIHQITKYDRSVLVFSHTSYADFYIMMLYLFAYPKNLHMIKTLIKPQPFKYAGSLLTSLGAIPSTKVDDRNGGAVNRIINTLRQYEKFVFLISPKGTIINRPWRSGYYHIAKEFKINLMAVGLDYEKKEVIISDEISSFNDEITIENYLKDKLKTIVPLYPEDEIVPIRHHNTRQRSIVDINRIISIVLISIALYYSSLS
jgi:1-acyl-sn-glycerol-3-phosphate acyltransferase